MSKASKTYFDNVMMFAFCFIVLLMCVDKKIGGVFMGFKKNWKIVDENS